MTASTTERLELVRDVIKPSARQREFLEAVRTHQFVLYGGAAGGGKSYILRWWLVKFLIELATIGITKATVGLFCEDYPSLNDRQISKMRFEFPDWLGTLKLGDTKDFVLRDEFGGGRIALRNLDDPSKYLSAEFAAVAVDELTRNEVAVFDFLRMRLRWPGVEKPRFVGGTNPGGRGHKWVKGYWVDRPSKLPKELADLAHEFAFVQAKAADNPHLAPSYYESLKRLPKAMADAYAEGDWNTFAGQFFDIFREQRHVRRPETFGMEPWWPRWVSVDWGFEHPSAVYWHAARPDGAVLTYREFVANHLSPRMLAQAIVERSLDAAGRGERIADVYLSPDAYARRSSDLTIADQIGDILAQNSLPRPTPADDDRIGGWMLMYQMLDSEQWVISSSCPKLIESLPVLVRDEVKVEDVAKMDGDDPADSARYGLKSRLAPGRKPVEQRIAEKLDAKDATGKPLITDSTSRMIWHNKLLAEERRSSAPIRRASRWRPMSQQ